MARQSLLSRQITPTVHKAAIPPLRSMSPQLRMINGRLVAYSHNPENFIVKGYMLNDIVYSIVKMISDKARVAPWGLWRVKDENAYKQFRAMIRQKDMSLSKVGDLQRKALTPVEDAGKWSELIKYPNDVQDFSNFTADGISFKLLTGNKFISANILQAGANAGVPFSLSLEPSQWINILASDTWPVRAIGYSISILAQKTFTREEILHEKYFNPEYDVAGSNLYGMSPLKAGLTRLLKSNMQTQAEAASWNNRGISGIIALKNQAGQVDGDVAALQVDALSETLRQEWTGSQNHGKMGTSGYSVDWIPIGMNAQEMALIESGLVDLRMMCNWYNGLPSQLMNDPARSTYNTVSEAEKALTTRCVMPELCAAKEAYNRKFSTDWGLPKGVVVDFDVSVYKELQEDVAKIADWTSKTLVIIPNQQNELLGLGAIDDPIFNEPWIQVGGSWVPYSEYKMNAVDNALNSDNADGTQGAIDDNENIQ